MGCGDAAMWTYVILAIVSLYGFCLFSWWWYKIKHVSDVYSYVTLMFAAIFLINLPQIYSRWFFAEYGSTPYYDEFMVSWLWQLRSIPCILILLVIVVQMTLRTMGIRKVNGRYYTQRNRRKDDL